MRHQSLFLAFACSFLLEISAPHIALPSAADDADADAGVGARADRIDLMQVFDSELYVAGTFTGMGESDARGLARFDGEQWREVGGSVDGRVHALIEYYGELIVGGEFQAIGDESYSNIARWDGSRWRAVGDGLPNAVYSLAIHDGRLIAASGRWSVPVEILEFTGAGWRRFAEWDEQLAPALASYRGDLFAAPRSPRLTDEVNQTRFSFLLRLVDGQWRPLADCPSYVSWESVGARTLNVLRDRLYVIGDRMCFGDVSAQQIGEWDGTEWRGLALPDEGGCDGGPRAHSLAWVGSRLVVSGFFPSEDRRAGGLYVRESERWQTLRGGALDGGCHAISVILCVAEFQGDMYAAGEFGQIGGTNALSIARYRNDEWEAVAVAPYLVLSASAVRVDETAKLQFGLSHHQESERLRVHRSVGNGAREPLPIRDLIGALTYTVIDSSAPVAQTDYWLERVESSETEGRWSGPYQIPTAEVEVRGLEVRGVGEQAILAWSIEPVADYARFHVWRGDDFEARVRASDRPVGPMVDAGGALEFVDSDPPDRPTTFWWLEQVLPDGRHVRWSEATALDATWSSRGIVAWPSPSGGDVVIAFAVPSDGHANLAIYDATGALCLRLLEQSPVRRGTSSVSWDGRDAGGKRLPSGVYWARLEVGGKTRRQTIVLTR